MRIAAVRVRGRYLIPAVALDELAAAEAASCAVVDVAVLTVVPNADDWAG